MFDSEADISTSSNLTPQKRFDLDIESQTLGLSNLSTPNMSSNKKLKKIKYQ